MALAVDGMPPERKTRDVLPHGVQRWSTCPGLVGHASGPLWYIHPSNPNRTPLQGQV